MRGIAHSGRPGTLPELVALIPTRGLGRAFSEFLDEFYRIPSPEAVELPPTEADPKTRAFLAGLADALCEIMGWTAPAWVAEEVVSPPVIWEVHHGALPDTPRVHAAIQKLAHPTFRRHGILVRPSVLSRV